MSSAQHVDTTEDPQSGTARADETTGLAASVMNRAQWMQRVLSPWTQRWLAAGDSDETLDRSGGQHPFAGLTSSDTQRTLARVRVQYESHSNLETLTTGGSLPLAGTTERPASAVEPAAPAASAAPRRAQGPYSRPFNSLDDFIHAIEAAKERDYAPPPTEVQPQPAPKRAVGPYSRPFHSMEEFVQAVNAAKERDYASPPELEPQSAPKREAGPYSRAFASFEDFVKAVEETRDQWGRGSAEEPTAETTAQPEIPPSMPARVRPISRIEELPARTETRSINSPIDFPAPPPEISQPAPQAKPAPAAQKAAPRSQPKSTTAVAPQSPAAPVSPQVQRSPLASSDQNALVAEVEPAVQRSVTPTLQRSAPTRSEPAAPTASDLAASAVAPEPDRVMQQLSQPAAPQANQPLDMPLVQRHAADSEQPEEVPSDVSAPIETEEPIVQRQAAEIPHQPDVNFTVPPSIEQSPARMAAPIVQRHATDTSSQPTASRTTPPSISEEDQSRTEEPIVQRHVADVSPQPAIRQAIPPSLGAKTPVQTEKPIEQRQTAGTVQPETVATPFARPDMPLVQRHAADDALEPEESVDESAPVVQRQIIETESATPDLPIASLSEAPALPPTLPVAVAPTRPVTVPRQTAQPPSPQTTVQRRVEVTVPSHDDHATAPSAEVAPTRSAQLPLVQRQPATTSEPAQPVESFADAPVDLSAASHPLVASLQPEKSAETQSARVDMPLVQRQAAETLELADEIDQAEEAVQRSVDLSSPAPAPAVPPTTPDKPVVQRQAAETKATTPVAPKIEAPRVPQTVQPDEKKIVAPLAADKSLATHVEMPLVQRQTAGTELEAADLGVEETAVEDVASTESLQRKATTTKALPRTTAAPTIKPTTPSVQRVQRHAAEPIDMAEPVQPLGDETQAAPPASVEAYAPQEMPFVPRQPFETKPTATPSLANAVQRSVILDETETSPRPTSDLSERILARVAPPERRAVTKPVDLPLHHAPVQRESQPEAASFSQPAAGENSSTSFAASSIIASPVPVIQRMAEPMIQRTASELDTDSSDAGFIQRVESVPAAEQAAEAAKPPDLDQLARQIYPLIKHMIAIERERRAFR